MSYHTPEVNMLDSMSYADLEALKKQLETVRHRILLLQNAQSALFKLPGELRNTIFLLAMQAEVLDRRETGKQASFEEPAFFRTSRQVKAECTGIWYRDVLCWEELVDGSPDSDDAEKDGISHVEKMDCVAKAWRRLDVYEVKSMCRERNKVGKLTLVTQPAHCDLRRTRDSVEGSRSICPRQGLVRVKGYDMGMPSLRWWVW
ncbi:hypothetical protein AC578_11031 [Pseudocercospora eumusae]|uniref:F-box domain-containing protein n=1 Tax=Pseudocercospora eumusae TaxID=321146 RepID=A0A139HSN6_9PEZI|nr:hypothetical protein AC578_11031 [Pseudocercospora eumusae]